jgi:endoglucanase
MPGGTCEGTVFDAHGYTAGAVCVPLGNYHNMDRERKVIGPEYIDLSDWQNEVKLFVRLGEQSHQVDLKFAGLKSRLAKRFASMRKYL